MDDKSFESVVSDTLLSTLQVRYSFASKHTSNGSQKALTEKNKLLLSTLGQLKKDTLTQLELLLLDIHDREDLDNLLQQIEPWQQLKTITLCIAKLDDSSIVESIIGFQALCKSAHIQLHVDIPLPENSDGFAKIADNVVVLDEIISFSKALIQHEINVRWLIPLLKPLIFKIEGLYLHALDSAIPCLLVAPERLQIPHQLSELKADEQLFVWDFITYFLLDPGKVTLSKKQNEYYLLLSTILAGQAPQSPIAIVDVLQYDPSSSNWKLGQQNSTHNLANIDISPVNTIASATSPLQQRLALYTDIAEVLLGGMRAHLYNSLTHLLYKQRTAIDITGKRYKKALLIGAYGGEHIGDFAILGGVLFRIHERYGIDEAVLFTQRPLHTRHLVPMLEVPVKLEVDLYEWKNIRKQLNDCDCIVFAGGPLIDLPKQLIRHLYCVALGRKLNKPFIVEGIGPGPFVRWVSKFTAGKLMQQASAISLRTSDCLQHDLVKDLQPVASHCPAFDYLDTRQKTLTRIPEHDNNDIDTLLQNTAGRKIIAINIRPIGHFYTTGADENDVEAYTNKVVDQFEQQLAEGITAYQRASKAKPCFIFFPMNAIQFGMSDILSAYRIQRHLNTDVDFRVWQGDASLDGVIAFLRHVDIAITMRFHATIFALSQHCKIIGIDYVIGKRDKIAELLDDAGLSENCTRIDLLTGKWLLERLQALEAEPK